MVGGVSINMVTKDAGNKWRGDMRYNYSTGCLTPQNPTAGLPRERQLADAGASETFLGNPTTDDLRLQRRRRRRAGQGPPVGQRLGPPVDRQQAGQRQERRRHAGDRRQHAEELLGQGRRSRSSSNQKMSFVLQLEQQDPRPSPRHAAELRARHRLAGPDQPGVVDAGEVHRHPQQAGVRVVVQHHERRDRLQLSAGHAGHRDPRRRHAGWTRANVRGARATSTSRTRACSSTTCVSYSASGFGGEHLFKGGVQFARLYYDDATTTCSTTCI